MKTVQTSFFKLCMAFFPQGNSGLEVDNCVTCELCQARTQNFNKHMRRHHPGCGGL